MRSASVLARLRGGVVAAASVVASCGGAVQVSTPPHLRSADLGAAGTIPPSELGRWTRVPARDVRQEVIVEVRDEVSKRGFAGRGVVAVRPGVALRMILLGPGGTTGMDVWMRAAKWRVAIPALERVVRGDPDTPPEKMRGLPIALLSRWLVSPFGGTIVAAHAGRVDEHGEVVADDAVGPSGTRSFVTFARRGQTFEVRARRVHTAYIDARAWWIERGMVSAFLVGEERPLGDAHDSPIFPVDVRYVAYDPPMSVHVHATSMAEVDPATPLPTATFADPDGE